MVETKTEEPELDDDTGQLNKVAGCLAVTFGAGLIFLFINAQFKLNLL